MAVARSRFRPAWIARWWRRPRIAALGDRAVAVTGASDSLAAGELDQARELAGLIGIRHEILATQEMADPNYLKNAPTAAIFARRSFTSGSSRLPSNSAWR